MGIRERLESLSRAELTGLIVVVVVTLAGAGLWYARSLPKPVQVASQGPQQPVPAAGAATGAAPLGASGSAVAIIVDVTGQVRRPGVYEFVQGDRVIDAVERAGGAKANADLTTLNLAALLADGTQILVPKQGKDGVVAGSEPGAGGSPGGAGTLVNVNSATATELEALPGIGPVLATAIVDHRTENGPFTSVDQLEDVSGIGPVTLEEIRDHATV